MGFGLDEKNMELGPPHKNKISTPPTKLAGGFGGQKMVFPPNAPFFKRSVLFTGILNVKLYTGKPPLFLNFVIFFYTLKNFFLWLTVTRKGHINSPPPPIFLEKKKIFFLLKGPAPFSPKFLKKVKFLGLKKVFWIPRGKIKKAFFEKKKFVFFTKPVRGGGFFSFFFFSFAPLPGV